MSDMDEPVIVRKIAAYLPISYEMAIDAGVMTEDEARARGWTPTPPVKIGRWTRLRWWWSAVRERWGRRIGSWIAGVDLSENDDW